MAVTPALAASYIPELTPCPAGILISGVNGQCLCGGNLLPHPNPHHYQCEDSIHPIQLPCGHIHARDCLLTYWDNQPVNLPPMNHVTCPDYRRRFRDPERELCYANVRVIQAIIGPVLSAPRQQARPVSDLLHFATYQAILNEIPYQAPSGLAALATGAMGPANGMVPPPRHPEATGRPPNREVAALAGSPTRQPPPSPPPADEDNAVGEEEDNVVEEDNVAEEDNVPVENTLIPAALRNSFNKFTQTLDRLPWSVFFFACGILITRLVLHLYSSQTPDDPTIILNSLPDAAPTDFQAIFEVDAEVLQEVVWRVINNL